MKRILLTTLSIAFIGFSSLSQNMAEKVVGYISDCSCREVIIQARGVEKSYAGTWLENIAIDDNFIVFQKGDYPHRWNADMITFIEKGNGFIRIFLE